MTCTPLLINKALQYRPAENIHKSSAEVTEYVFGVVHHPPDPQHRLPIELASIEPLTSINRVQFLVKTNDDQPCSG
jgi:hypothetical protein